MRLRIAAASRALLLLPLVLGVSAARAERRASQELGRSGDLRPDDDESSVLEHVVTAGEKLQLIATRYEVDLGQLLALNPGLDPDRIRVGQRIAIDRDRSLVRVTIQPGDRLQLIAGSYELKVADLLRWNPQLDPDRIRPGQVLSLYPRRPSSPSESIGSPSRGQLVQARRLPEGPGYQVRAPERAWGTDETVRGLISAFARARREHPDAPRLSVHDLSLRQGGRIDEHRSHQSGRDVDIAYPQKQCPRTVRLSSARAGRDRCNRCLDAAASPARARPARGRVHRLSAAGPALPRGARAGRERRTARALVPVSARALRIARRDPALPEARRSHARALRLPHQRPRVPQLPAAADAHCIALTRLLV